MIKAIIKYKIPSKSVELDLFEKSKYDVLNELNSQNNFMNGIISLVSKEESDKMYDDTLAYMLDNINQMAVFAGTHNELSSYKLMQLMAEKGLSNNDNRIWFGQLYGMSDNISYNLAANGYNVAKYLPFGPVRDVMPYLIRRAEENTSVAGQTSRELMLIKKERERRKLQDD